MSVIKEWHGFPFSMPLKPMSWCIKIRAVYAPTIDKKGGLKMRLIVNGRMMRGTYQITMGNNTNVADVIFTPSGKSPIKFQGPIVPLKGANYYKRSNPM